MSEDWAPGERGRAIALATAMLTAVAYPLRMHLVKKGKRRDGFPLSYYPMFSQRRKDTVKINYGIGIHADDSRHYLPHGTLGTGGLNQIRRQLNRVVREERAEAFVETVAARVAVRPDLTDIVRVEIVQGEFNIDDCFLKHRVEGTEEILATADVVRLPGVDGTGAEIEVSTGPAPDAGPDSDSDDKVGVTL